MKSLSILNLVCRARKTKFSFYMYCTPGDKILIFFSPYPCLVYDCDERLIGGKCLYFIFSIAPASENMAQTQRQFDMNFWKVSKNKIKIKDSLGTLNGSCQTCKEGQCLFNLPREMRISSATFSYVSEGGKGLPF